MTRAADRRCRQPYNADHNTDLHAVLFEHLANPTSSDNLREQLDDLEVESELTDAQGLAMRACIDLLEGHLDDADALLDSAAELAAMSDEKILVLHVQALLAVRRGLTSKALKLALNTLWIDSDPRLWVFFLMIAHRTSRTDVVEATLVALAEVDFFGDEELQNALVSDVHLKGLHRYEAYQVAVAPRLLHRTNN